MIIKFLRYGTGDPQKAANYLLSMTDHNGRIRPEVRVLRGNPLHVATVAASLSNVHRYTSAVIAWAPEDQPTTSEVNEVIADFERLAFAGLGLDQVCHTVVSHGDHVHILVVRVDLHTGKAMNIAPPLWQKHFDHLRNYWNHSKGWARPDDPSRARLVQADGVRTKGAKGALLEAERVSAETGFAVSDVLGAMGVEPSHKQVIADHLLRLVHEGDVKNRQDVVNALAEFGAINRLGEDYISIKAKGGEKNIRFKGAMFHKDFDASIYLRQAPVPNFRGRAQPNLDAAEAAKLEVDAAIERRAQYYRQRLRFPRPVPEVEVINPESNGSQIFKSIEEQENERNRNTVVAEAQRAFRSARSAVASFIRACVAAVNRLGSAEQGSADSLQAGIQAERACRIVNETFATLNAVHLHKSDHIGKTRLPRTD